MPGRGASQEAIQHHYDVGRDFYALWLDPTLTYSCALWPDDRLDDDLDAAQDAKLAWHAHHLGADGPDPLRRVLDVGCGWGSMMAHLTDRHGVTDVTGLTLSGDQAAHVAAAGRAGTTVQLTDWADHRPATPYDGIVSIGAFEHFARPELDRDGRRAVYAAFFARAWSWLVPGGRLSLQTIAMEDEPGGRGAVHDFLSKEVFPESQLPRLSDITDAADRWFRTAAVRADPTHYEHTLHLWQRRLEAAREEVEATVGRPTYKHYLRYLRVCRAMFDRGTCTLYRVALRRRDDPDRLTAALGPWSPGGPGGGLTGPGA